MPEHTGQPETKTFEHDGKQVVGRRIDVVGRSEPSNTFSLSDGAVLSVRLILIDVYKLEGVSSKDGGPVYRYGSQVITHIWPPQDKEG